MFWVDLASLLPLDAVTLWFAANTEGGASATALGYFQLFRVLRLVRD